MSASNGRPLGATGSRSGAAAPARRTVRNHWFVVRSNWLKATLPANSLTAVAAPGEAIVSACATGATTPRAARAAARTRRRRDMPCERMSAGGRDADRAQAFEVALLQPLRQAHRGDVLLDLRRRGRAEEHGRDLGVGEGEGDRQLGRWCFQLRTEEGELFCRGEGGGVLRVVSLLLDAAVRALARVLAGEGAGRERGRGDDARPGRVEGVDRLGILDRLAAHEVVRQLDGRGHRNALALGATGGLGEVARGPVEQAPGPKLPARDERAGLRDDVVDRQPGRRLL